METNQNSYKRTLAGSVGAGVGALFNGNGHTYYILEHKTETAYHHLGESQKIIIDQIELGRSATCQVRFDESCETVSRRHAAIIKEGDKCKLIALSQTNGTYVNGNLVKSEYYLNSGDEIRLSSNGPVLGFIQPQGSQSLVKSIGLTERMNLFRRQALRPYKVAITVLSIVLVLAICGLGGYNIYQDSVHKKEMAAMQELVDKANEEVSQTQHNLDEANADVAKQQLELLKLQSVQDATQAQIEEAQNRVAIAEARSRAAQSAAYAATAKMQEAQDKLNSLAEKKGNKPQSVASVEPAERGSSSRVSANDNESVSESISSGTGSDSDISQLVNNVYFIRMDKVTVYDSENALFAEYPCDDLIYGTGFLLNDGRFVTARRIARPWDYYINSEENLRRNLGRDNKGNFWKFEDVQICYNAGLKVVGEFTAFSPAGSSFKFSSIDMRVDDSTAGIETFSFHGANAKVEKEIKVPHKTYSLYMYNSKPSVDWAVMDKKDLVRSANGLKADAVFSYDPKGAVEVQMLGYPGKRGFSGTSAHPVSARNTINASGLNKGIIEMSSYRFEPGFDGAPVLAKIDGEWRVIGILGHTDGAKRDNVTPIANIY